MCLACLLCAVFDCFAVLVACKIPTEIQLPIVMRANGFRDQDRQHLYH